jgi:uncharacterized protein (UPF0261 family)
MAMEELAAEGLFDGILDYATHELADELKQGYCRGVGPQRLLPVPGMEVPRLVVPGGLDCAVLEFTRDTIPEEYRERMVFFYDFRSAVRLDETETLAIADQLAEKLNRAPSLNKVLIPMEGWSEADGAGAPLYDPGMRDLFLHRLKKKAVHEVDITEMDLHINDEPFARAAAKKMDEMVRESHEG